MRPNVDFLHGSGIVCENGVVVDATMQTNVPGVYAAGDVAAGDRPRHRQARRRMRSSRMRSSRPASPRSTWRGGTSRRAATWPSTCSTRWGSSPRRSGKWWGEPGGGTAELIDAREFRYLCLQFDGDVMIGATAIGLTEHVGVLRGLIEGRVRLGPWKDRLLAEPLRFPDAYLARAPGRGLTAAAPMQVTLKLYASLADHLPAEARSTHRLPLDLPAGTTVADGHRATEPAAEALPSRPRQRHLHRSGRARDAGAAAGRRARDLAAYRRWLMRVAEGEVLAFAQDMTISRDAFLRSLPAAVDDAAFRIDGGTIRPVDPDQKWRIVIAALGDLSIGMIRLPRHRVEIFLRDCGVEETRRFLARFELYFRRAGG